MAATATISALLASLSNSLASVIEGTQKLTSIEPVKGGISILDVKNELLLSYLQTLVFLILLKIRVAKNAEAQKDAEFLNLGDSVVRKLVELRLYIEKGVRPLEDKLRYQVEKVLRAASDGERRADAAAAAVKQTMGRKCTGSGSGSGSIIEGEHKSSDTNFSDEGEAEKEDDNHQAGLRRRPNLHAMMQRDPATGKKFRKEKEETSGVYRPPRLNPTVMPTTSRREKAERKPEKSATLDEFIADELSTAPVAEPSIGTNIVQGGRRVKTAKERKIEEERRDYEEAHFVRLPGANKKEWAQQAKLEGRSGRMNFGGEEWRELGLGVDRINRLTKGKSSGTRTRALLEKSRKRDFDTSDGQRGSGTTKGADVGERYLKRLKMMEGGRKKTGRKVR